MMTIDLHGYHIHEGWRRFNKSITECYFNGYRRVIVITGQGAMMTEFPSWAQNHPKIKEFRTQPYNPGSFTVILNKKG